MGIKNIVDHFKKNSEKDKKMKEIETKCAETTSIITEFNKFLKNVLYDTSYKVTEDDFKKLINHDKFLVNESSTLNQILSRFLQEEGLSKEDLKVASIVADTIGICVNSKVYTEKAISKLEGQNNKGPNAEDKKGYFKTVIGEFKPNFEKLSTKISLSNSSKISGNPSDYDLKKESSARLSSITKSISTFINDNPNQDYEDIYEIQDPVGFYLHNVSGKKPSIAESVEKSLDTMLKNNITALTEERDAKLKAIAQERQNGEIEASKTGQDFEPEMQRLDKLEKQILDEYQKKLDEYQKKYAESKDRLAEYTKKWEATTKESQPGEE